MCECVCVVFYLFGRSCQSSLVGRDTGSPGRSLGTWPHCRMGGRHSEVQLRTTSQPRVKKKKIKLGN